MEPIFCNYVPFFVVYYMTYNSFIFHYVPIFVVCPMHFCSYVICIWIVGWILPWKSKDYDVSTV